MSYPVYIPLYLGPTGPLRPRDGGIVLVLLGGMFYLIHDLYAPKFQMKIIQNDDGHSVNVYIRAKNYPKITRITNQNMTCLKKKGYSIIEMLDSGIYSNWRNITTLKMPDNTNIYKENFIADCKECDAHTEIIYKYDNEFGNEVQSKKKLYWSKCYVDELK